MLWRRYRVVFPAVACALIISGLAVAIAADSAPLPDPKSFYAEDYREARTKFLGAVKARGGELTSFGHPLPGPDGEAMFTDVGRFGSLSPKSVLVVASGTHGVEGFAGSAIQVGLLQQSDQALIAPQHSDSEISVVLIHAVNPFGFAHLRRFNKNNVDVNRNFRDHAEPTPRNDGYDQLHSVIAPLSISTWGDVWARVRFYWYRLIHGSKALQAAVSGGQYSFPDGLFYGGDADSWSRQTMEEIMSRFIAGAAKLVFIDIHTGLGPYGNAELITNEPKDSPEYRRALELWGDMVRTTHSKESYSVDISGAMKLALRRMLPNTEVTAVSLEFGTYPGPEVFWALREENWLYNHGGDAYPDRERIKRKLLDMFYPADTSWRHQVWEQGSYVIGKALQHLLHTDSPDA